MTLYPEPARRGWTCSSGRPSKALSKKGTPLATVPLAKRAAAELLGTAWLVFGGCGSAVLAAKFLTPDNANVNLGIGFVGVAPAFGLTVLIR